MIEYVVGFLHDGRRVALVEKNRPAWQAGRWNGIGGKVEEGEWPTEAMVREFEEEAGLHVEGWKHVCVLSGEHSRIYVYSKKVDTGTLLSTYTVESEPIGIFLASAIRNIPHLPNLDWLVPLAMHEADDYRPFSIHGKVVNS